MKKLLFTSLLLAIIGVAVPRGVQAAVQPQPPDMPPSPILITSYEVYQDNELRFIQLYNSSSALHHLEGWELEIEYLLPGEQEDEEVILQIPLEGWLPARKYTVVAAIGGVAGADLEVDMSVGLPDATIEKLRIVPLGGEFLPYETPLSNEFASGIRYDMQRTPAGNYTANTSSQKFQPPEGSPPLYGFGLYFPADNAPLRVVEIFPNSRNCAPLENAADCRDYVKLYNPTGSAIDLSLYRLRIGWGNQSAGINNSFNLSGLLEPGQYTSVLSRDDSAPYNITASGGNVWLEDAYGIKIYEETLQAYEDLGGARYRGFSWAYNFSGGDWGWAVPNPSGPNDFSRQPEETPPSTGLKPCAPGQERNPATNRCRAVSSASTLTPCRPGQERNPETNRCRAIASAASALQSCGPGQERNPETNRCRKVAAANTAALPDVQDIESVTQGNPYRWWVAGGAVTLVAAYAVYEWRRDIAGFIRKFTAKTKP